MDKKAGLTFFLFIIFGSISFSQNSYRLVETPRLFVLKDANFTGMVNNAFFLPQKAPFLFSLNAAPSFPEQNNSLHFSHYEIPKGAIFCRMENNLRNTFNIWIKIRAGTEESYNEIKPQ